MPDDKTLRLNTEFIRDASEARKQKRKEITAKLIKAGIAPASQPIDVKTGRTIRPELAGVLLAELSPVATLNLLGQYGAWLEYVEGQGAKYRVRLSAAKRRTRDIKAQIRTQTPGTTADKADAATLDSRFKSADSEEYEAEIYVELIEAAISGGDRSFGTVSRAITSQGHELDRVIREHNKAPKRGGDYGVPKTNRKK